MELVFIVPSPTVANTGVPKLGHEVSVNILSTIAVAGTISAQWQRFWLKDVDVKNISVASLNLVNSHLETS